MGFLGGIFRSRDKPTDSTVGSRYAFSMGGTPAGKSVTEKTAMDLFSLEMFENIAYVMAKHADPEIPDTPEEWLDEFSTFSIYQVLPKIIELWGLNMKTEVEAKKNFVQQTVR